MVIRPNTCDLVVRTFQKRYISQNPLFMEPASAIMRVMENMHCFRNAASTREEHVFFIYDREALKSEYDDPETAILFFCPSTVSIEQQCSLCGQLVGMVSFVEGLLSMKPRVFRLKNGKFAVKCVKKYVMVLGGKLTDPDNLLFKLLTDLYEVFQFFHKSFETVVQKNADLIEVKNKMLDIWHCYVPFVKHYRQDMLTFFDTIQYMDFGKLGSLTFLRAMQILEACQRRTQSLCGCILSKQKVIASQIQPEILRFLSFIRPGQQHLPVAHLSTSGSLPQGVQIFPVYISRKAYEEIVDIANRTPYSVIKKKRRTSLSKEADPETKSIGKRLDSGETFLSNVSKSLSLGRSLQTKLPETGKSLMSLNNSADRDSIIPFKIGDAINSCMNHGHIDAVAPSSVTSSSISEFSRYSSVESESIGRSSYASRRTNGESFDDIDTVLEKQYGGQLADLRESVRRFNLCYENPQRTVSSIRGDQIEASHATVSVSHSLASTEDEVALNAYQRTCEYIETCIENRKCKQLDESEADETLNKCADSNTEHSIEKSHVGIENCSSFVSKDGDGKTDSSDVAQHVRLDSEENDLNVMDVEKSVEISEPSLVSVTSSDFEYLDSVEECVAYEGSAQVFSDPNVGEKKLQIEGSDSTSVTPTRNLNSESHVNEFISRTPANHDWVDKQSANHDIINEESTRKEMLLKGVHVNDKNVDEIDAGKNETMGKCDRYEEKRKENDVRKGFLSESIKKEKVTQSEVNLSGDDGYASMDKDLDAQRNEASESELLENEGKGSDELQHDAKNTDEELRMLHLYVQAHSNTILMVLLEPQKDYDHKMLRSMYEIVVPQLGDLEVSVQQLLEYSSEENINSDEFVYFMYNEDQKKYAGNCKFISQKDYSFGSAIENLHSQFANSKTMIDATFRDYTTAIYGKRSCHTETYYQTRGNYKPMQGAPTPYDGAYVMDRRINNKLKKDKVGIVL